MSSADAQIAFQQSGQGIVMDREDHFAQQFDLEHPDQAMSSYQRIMHEHTMRQFQSASESSRRQSKDNDTASQRSRGSVCSSTS